MIVNDVAFLCGYFSVKSDKPADIIASQVGYWTKVNCPEEDMAWARDLYYPEFTRFILSDVETYSHVYDMDLNLSLRGGGTQTVRLAELRVYLMPFDIIMYSIKVEQSSQQMQDVLDALFTMRNICSMKRDDQREYVEYALDPLAALNKAAGNPDSLRSLMECGNKLKIFHTLRCSEKPQDDAEFDALLYGAGTLSIYKENDPMGFSKNYYDDIMSGSRVSVFNNWKALSLLDTFTIVAHDVDDFKVGIWNKEYFGKLYIYSLYRKFFLFRINDDFRSQDKKISAVRKDLALFEKDYIFPKVCYNFLPELVINSMEAGLDIENENVRIADMITRENSRREEEMGYKMNFFLGVITCLTLFSAIWDFACLMDGLFEFSATIGTATGVRACAMLLISVICIVALFIRRK